MPSAYSLPRIPYLRLRFTLTAREQAALPPYHGSLLRGAFGHALRAAVCSMGPAQPCGSCRLRAACPYTRIFETLIEGEPPPFLKGLSTAPRPYVFEPRCATETFSPGDPLDFDLLLFGQAADLSPYAVLAVERMAAAGLGVRRHRFALDRVEATEETSGGREVYSRARGAAPPGVLSGPLPVLPPAERPESPGQAGAATPRDTASPPEARWRLVGGQFVEGDVEALEYGSERPRREIARVSGDDRRTVGTGVMPDLMAAFALPL